MPVNNILANLFASLQNAEMRRKKECMVIPASNLASEVMRVLQKKRYIGEFEFIDDGVSGKLRVQLLGRINRCGAITPRFPDKDQGVHKVGEPIPSRGRRRHADCLDARTACSRTPRLRRRTLEVDS